MARAGLTPVVGPPIRERNLPAQKNCLSGPLTPSRLVLLLVVLAFGAAAARAQTVLFYADHSVQTETPHYGAQALTQLNIPYTTLLRGGATTLATALGSGSYTFVLVEAYDTNLSSTDSAALVSFIAGGGRAIVGYWSIEGDAVLQTALGVSVATDLNTPETITVWETGHAAMRGVASPLVPIGDPWWGDNGDKFTLLSGSVALAGYASTPTGGQAAIVLANGGRTIVNGFLASDYTQAAMLSLFTAQIPAVSGIPEPSTWLLGLLGLAVIPLLRRGRRDNCSRGR